jgi:hypothetical protein
MGPLRLLLASLGLAIVSVAALAVLAVGTLVGWIVGGWVGLAILGFYSYHAARGLWLQAIVGITALVTPKPPDVGWSRGLCGVLSR